MERKAWDLPCAIGIRKLEDIAWKRIPDSLRHIPQIKPAGKKMIVA